jgi:hypothetical protein
LHTKQYIIHIIQQRSTGCCEVIHDDEVIHDCLPVNHYQKKIYEVQLRTTNLSSEKEDNSLSQSKKINFVNLDLLLDFLNSKRRLLKAEKSHRVWP